ncbi:MAG TPA: ABC-2 family transporter protein, partial [Clostridia bacterium]|nr:ABC-2 family transporter protein [Clostridia bacterium]
ATALMCFGLAELVSRGFDSFPNLIRKGDFDRILLRPRSTFLQAMTIRFHLHRLSRVVGGGILLTVCLSLEGIRLSPLDALMLLQAVVAGWLTYTGVFIFICAVSFFTIQPLDWMYVFTNGSYQVAKVPYPYLPAWLKRMFTVAVPMFLFCYYPLAAICGWGEPYWMGFLALPAGAAFFLLSKLSWNIGVRHYGSTGS